MEQIKVTISNAGEVSYEVSGVKGRGCKELTKAIDALGVVKESKLTGEYCAVETRPQVKQGR